MTRRKDILARSRTLKRKRAFLRLFLVFLFFLTMFAIAVWFFHWDYFSVDKFNVKGTSAISADEIKEEVKNNLTDAHFRFFPNNNVFLISKEELSGKLLNKFPRIGKIKIGRNIPDGIDIKITERKNSALACAGEDCAFIDENGFIFEKAAGDEEENFLRFFDKRISNSTFIASTTSPRIGENILSEEEFKKILKFKEDATGSGFNIAEIHIEEGEAYVLKTDEGWNAILNNQTDVTAALANLTLSLNREIKGDQSRLDYIDLRFGNKIFYKFKE